MVVHPPQNDEDNETREVYARYGLAVYMSQVLEHGMVNVLTIKMLMPKMGQYKTRAEWEVAFDQFQDESFSQTFGNLKKRIEKLEGIPRDLSDILSRAKAARDDLAHRFFRVHAEMMVSADGRQQLIERCDEATTLFEEVDQQLYKYLNHSAAGR